MLSVDARNSLELATQEYHKQIDVAGPYLEARGISRETALTYRLGYVHEPMVGHEQYAGRLSIPYITPTGVVDIRFRALSDDGGPKYLSRPGATGHMFGVNAFTYPSEIIAIAEGEIDCMILNQVGIPAVGLPGANGWRAWYARAFPDYRSVIVLCDGDGPGKEMGKQIAQQLDTTTVIFMPDGMDVNEVYLLEGADGLRKRVGL